MNLFRSGEHIERWLAGREPGATIPVERLSELAHAWYGDRLSPDWRPRTQDSNQAILGRLGLAGDFWHLPGSQYHSGNPLPSPTTARQRH